jgi:hypothetical protein
MRRRVSIARAIISHPDLILYDSPTGGLDPITSTTIIELVMKQRDVWHTTSLVVTHRLQDAFMLASTRQRHRYSYGADGGIDGGTKFLLLNCTERPRSWAPTTTVIWSKFDLGGAKWIKSLSVSISRIAERIVAKRFRIRI